MAKKKRIRKTIRMVIKEAKREQKEQMENSKSIIQQNRNLE
ncbi:hypothetical protein AWH56_26510 [Anaerobacillus isosaccharinicus]|uniref:Uncharacterized protein n=1 Tax=Anaerobacillus isosaccharinicus TaxID=1532552 RepID=A0AC62A4L6_9BACI|nr:hypothetical protein [Anaerobacillus isosaccharinicus]